MDANKIVMHVMETDRMGVVLDLLAKRVRQPSEPPHAHPHRQVRSLRIARADMLRVRFAGDRLSAGADTFSRRAVGAPGSVIGCGPGQRRRA